ncbi:hypothetical protein [Spirosoma sordidisoli]|uniref:Uncharacterized protein n=1 Tax=Spirosoma sordidisoli TaxID=2502893 RepID=A0A4Q2UPM6_9BACT|nr:hypothetical protein [Spirosoma sordidisoli]RYC70852.1 hypothetical protein EQG79_01490 [Spirosoma sordidisoli]
MERTIFRLKTAIQAVGIDEPFVINPQIREPVLWSGCLLVGSVDEQFHGFVASYSEGDLKLEFYCEHAHAILSQQYYTYGTDAEVKFQVVHKFGPAAGQEEIDFQGKIDFATIVIEAGKVSASIIVGGIAELVKNRWETPVSVDATLTLDNKAIVPPTGSDVNLAGMTLREKAEFSKQGKYVETETFENAGLGGVFYVLPDMLPDPAKISITPPRTDGVVSLDELAGVTPYAGGIFSNAISPPLALLTCETAGTYLIEIDWLFRVNVSLTKSGGLLAPKAKFARLTFLPVLLVRVPGKADQRISLAAPKNGNGFVNSVEHSLTASYRGSLDLPQGAQLFVFCEIPCFMANPVKRIDFTVTMANLRIAIDRRTRATASRAGTYMMPDVLKHVVGVVAGNLTAGASKTGRVVGSLIEGASTQNGQPGPASEYALTTGALLRGLKKAPSFSLKTLMGTLWAHHAAGILYEDMDTDSPTVRVEAGEWFYRDTEILELETVFAYREEPETALLHNQIVVGYEKYPDAGAGVAEEFNTERTYQTPLISSDQTLEIKCPLIAAGTAIEEARRLGIKKLENGVEVPTTSDAGSYDDDGFMLHVASQSFTDTAKFWIDAPTLRKPYAAKYITLSSTMLSRLVGGVALKVGDVLTFTDTGTPNDGKPFRIIGTAPARPLDLSVFTNPTYEVALDSDLTPTGTVTTTWTLGTLGVKLRTNERLDVEGVTDPANAYNLELSPARMLRRHAPFINSGLAYKQAIDELRCTAYKHNGAMVTQAKPSVPALPGDSDKQLIRETGNVALGELDRFEKLFRPERIIATVYMTRKQRRILFKAMRNEGDEALRLGYVTVRNADGNKVSGYLRRIVYNDQSETAELVLRKKRVAIDPGGPACQDYRSWSFGRFESDTTANPNLYRFCRFSDFD